MQAAALIDLWTEGYIEPIEPPAEPYHILAQQFMALALQEQGIGLRTWFDWMKRVPAFEQMPTRSIEGIVEWMLQREIIWEEQGIAGIGRRGEETYGRRHFMELLSVFTSPPLFHVLHGREEVGFVDELTFLGKRDPQHVLLLGGRAWGVTHIDWQSRIAYVTVSDDKGISRWRGEGQSLGFRLCQAIKSALVSEQTRTSWSRRACDQMIELRREFAWLTHDNSTVLFDHSGKCAWWTFAGLRANATLASTFTKANLMATADNLAVRFEELPSVPDIERAFQDMRSREASNLVPAVDEAAVDGLKFSECLPPDLAKRVLEIRNRDDAGVERVLRTPIRIVSE
jgi:ATP-dependent Lhr-like helicase